MKKKTMIIIAVALVLVIAIVAGALFMMMNKSDEEKLYFHVPGEYFVTNIKDSNNSLLKVTVTLGVTTDKEEEYLTANNAIIRNDIVFILRTKTKEELRSPDIEELLSAEICQKLSEDLKLDIFKRVYFSDLVIQGN